MALSSPAYTNDAVWAQRVHLFIAGSSKEVGGMQSMDMRMEVPKEISADTMGKSRLRRTGPMQVRWTARRWMLQRSSLVDLLGPDIVSNPNYYGNYNWDDLIFDILEMYTAVSPVGAVAVGGGWSIRYATVTEWGVSHSDPYAYWTEDIQGIGLGMFQNPWS